jgi:hypothetical protein
MAMTGSYGLKTMNIHYAKSPSSDRRVFSYTDDPGIRRWFAAIGNVYR